MKLREIYFNNVVLQFQTNTFNNNVRYIFKKSITDFGDHHYGLFENEKLVSYLQVETESNIWQVRRTIVDSNLRGLGLMRYLFNRVLDDTDELYSDTHQTPESKKFWIGLIKYPEPRYSIFVLHDGSKISVRDYSNYDIWNNDEDPILVMVRKPLNSSLNEVVKTDEVRKRFNRHDWELWYGDYVRNIGYENP
jgi:hypothetical protein